MRIQPLRVSCTEAPALNGTLLVLPGNTYQFLFLGTKELSRTWDGCSIVASLDAFELGSTQLLDGHAVLRLDRTPSAFRLDLRDGITRWALRIESPQMALPPNGETN
jgi:hypothetical protein